MKAVAPLVVAGLATMPSRLGGLPLVFDRILNQVDRLYLYCDGHVDVPVAARGDPRITPILSRDVPGLHTAGKFFGLTLLSDPCLYLGIDDDIHYPRDYVPALRGELEARARQAVVGYHGAVFDRPFKSYLKSRTSFHFSAALPVPMQVDTLGSGTVLFASETLRFDVRSWPDVNMADLWLAIETTRRRLPLVCMARGQDFLRPISENQLDSVFRRLQRDDSRQTILARDLMDIQRRNPQRRNPIADGSKITCPEVFAAP